MGQYPVVGRLGNWVPDTVTLRGSLQGLALHGRNAVLLRHGGQCLVLDMHKRKMVVTYPLAGNTSHCNNASFGPVRYEKDDPLPLLYVSGCYGDKACYVTRLMCDSSLLVQRIFYDSDCFPIAQDWCVDAEGRYLYAYGGKRGGMMYLKKFALPELSVAEVHLTDNNVLQTIPITCVNVAQGSKIKNGYAYLPDGDSPGNYWLHIVDLTTGREVRTIDLNPIGLEPEGVDLLGRWIYVSFNTPNPKDNTIYRFRRKRKGNAQIPPP
ncbi:MAG: hypothetical protein IJK84_07050 [Bacteroidales bacterium]|nr:hypothetical protein [Bacteroidales bacterium]